MVSKLGVEMRTAAGWAGWWGASALLVAGIAGSGCGAAQGEPAAAKELPEITLDFAKVKASQKAPAAATPKVTADASFCPYNRFFADAGAPKSATNLVPPPAAPSHAKDGCVVRTYAQDGRLVTEEHANRNQRAVEVLDYDALGAVSHHRVSSYDGAQELSRSDVWMDGNTSTTRTETWTYSKQGVSEDLVVDGRQGWSTRDRFSYDSALVAQVEHAEGVTLDAMAPQQLSVYHYGPGALLADVSVTGADGSPVSKTTYSYFDSGKLAASHWAAEGLEAHTLDQSFDADGHVVRLASKENGAGSEVSNTFAAGQLFASDVHHEDGTTQNTQSTRNFYDDSLRLVVSVSLIADAYGDGTPVTGFEGTRYVRSDDGRVARVEMDRDGDCTADGFITYAKASADGAVVEQRLGSAVSPGAARRTFSAECAVDLSNPPANPYAI